MALTQEVAPGVHRVADGIVNWDLVSDGGEVALYDAGWPRSWPRVEAAVATVHVHRREVARAHGQAEHSSPFALVPGLLPTLWRPTATAFVLERDR